MSKKYEVRWGDPINCTETGRDYMYGVPQCSCGHNHETLSDALECDVAIEMEANGAWEIDEENGSARFVIPD